MSTSAARADYHPRNQEATILHKVVRDHLEEFLMEARERFDDGYSGVPDFVENELRRFLACGHLAGGFAASRRWKADVGLRFEKSCH